ncbi:MAG: penicillin-binding protein 2 [Campylobacterota bacterium]|nr:penicillin-binding protein 2 [Campylobacterota bacterium]
MNYSEKRLRKFIYLFLVFIILLILLIFSIVSTVQSDRKVSLTYGKKEISVRGDIFCHDKEYDTLKHNKTTFTVAQSKKMYKAVIDTRYLDPNKKNLFIKLFSIYSDISSEKIKHQIDSLDKAGKIVLSYNIDSRTAQYLKELEYKLLALKVFQPRSKNSANIVGLNIIVSGERRFYAFDDTLTPVLGYIRKVESKNGLTRVSGIKGLEKSYNKILNNTQDGLIQGSRDVSRYVVLDKNSIVTPRVDGSSLILNIPLILQKDIEMMLDYYKQKFSAKEIIVSVMDSMNGKIYTLATSNRFTPNRIRQIDYPNLNVNAIEHPFEPGSVIKPIAMVLAFDKGVIKKNQLFNAHNKGKQNAKGNYPKGRYKIGRHTIGDDHQFSKHHITPADIIVYSSNIGILKIAQKIKALDFYNGYKKFGLSVKTGIDLPYERTGVIHSLKQYKAYEKQAKDNIYKATDSYGQGITSTFMQILKAYSVFNNDGKISTPKIVSHAITSNNSIIKLPQKEPIRIISKKSATVVKKMLVKTVEKGTGRGTKIQGIEIGGKTGTAQIARKGKYQRRYISSFFGFANDAKRKFTIGVTVFEPNAIGKNRHYRYASQSAVPVFKEVVQRLVKYKYLIKR